MDDSKTLKSIDNKLSALIALIALLVTSNAEERAEAKPEVLLSNVGLENSEIAKILGKKLGAVQKAIQRARE